MSLARPGGVWRGNRKTTSSILRPVAPRDISKLRSSSSARLLAFRLGARRLGDLPGWLRPDPSRGSHSTPRDRRVRRTVARTRGETNPADPRRVVARARRLAVGSKTRLARSCAPRTRWRGWRWPLPRRARRRATHSSPARDLAPGEPRASSAPSSRSASLFPSARAASLRRERAPTTRARSRAGSPTARVTLRRRRPRDPPRGSPPRPRAPRAPSRRARGGAMRPTRRRRGRRRGRLLRGRRPRESGTTRRHLVQPPRPSPSEQTPAPEIKYKPPGVSKRRSSSSPSVVVNPIPPSQRVPQPRASEAPATNPRRRRIPSPDPKTKKRQNRRPRTSPPQISSAARTRWRARRRVCVAPYRRYHPRRRRRRS